MYIYIYYVYIYIYTSYRQTSFPRSSVVVYPKHPGFISLSTSPCCNLLGKRLRLRTILGVETPRFRVRSVPSMRLKPMTTWSNQNQYKKDLFPKRGHVKNISSKMWTNWYWEINGHGCHLDISIYFWDTMTECSQNKLNGLYTSK